MAGYIYHWETFYIHESMYLFRRSLCNRDPEKANTRRNEKRIPHMKASK